jgi:ElaB/YqjD/DUF883 family membrane-anchored ribosome-binding protein
MNERDYTEEQLEAEAAYRAGYVPSRDEELGNKSPEDLEAEIEQIRRELDATLSQIERKFSPGELFDRALHYVQGGPSDYATNLNAAIKANPIPAALMGISLGWLMLSTEARRGGSAGVSFDRARGKSSEASEKIRSKAGEVSHKVSEKVHRAGERLHEMGDKAKAKRRDWEETRHQGAERTGEAMHAWKEKAYGAKGQLEESTHRYGERMKQTKGTLADAIHEQPILLGVLGAAAGALLGAMLPPTRQEDEWLGESGDQIRQRARETGREQMEKAKHVASAAAETAREEGERQLH